MKVSISPNGTNHYESQAPADAILVGTVDGIVELTRSGAGWRQSAQSLEGKHIASITVEPRSGAIYAGTHGNGVWASDDDGQSWERRDNGIEFDNIYGLNHVRVGEQVRLYAGTEPAHLWMSEDLGRNWTEVAALRTVPSVNNWTFGQGAGVSHVKGIVFDPRDPDTIYISIEVGGAFKTTDGGRTWREMNDGGFYLDVHRMMIPEGRPDEVYMATGRGLYHSPDAGNTWERLRLPESRVSYPDALVALPQNPDLMFTGGAGGSPPTWGFNGGALARMARSRDAGRTWEYLEGGLPTKPRANLEAMTLSVYPGGFALFAGTTDGEVFYSDDEGEHWSTIAQGLAPVSKAGHYRSLNPEYVAAHA